MKKILTIIIILIMVASLFVGCKKEEELTSVAIIDETMEVSLDEALFYVFTMQGQYEASYGPEFLFSEYSPGMTFGDMLKEEALNQAIIINMSAYVAEKQGIILEEERIDELKLEAKGYFEALNATLIEENKFLSLELFEEVVIENALREELVKKINDNAQIDEAILAEELERLAAEDPLYGSIEEYGLEESAISVRAKHILLLTVDAENNPLPEQETADAYALAEKALERAKAGENFQALVAEYSQDPGSADTGGEYTFARGEFVKAFETTAYAMESGEISDIVETEYGYHIIKLEEKDIEPTEEQIASREDYVSKIKEYAKSLQNATAFQESYSLWEKEYTIETKEEIWNDVYVKGQSQPDSSESDQ